MLLEASAALDLISRIASLGIILGSVELLTLARRCFTAGLLVEDQPFTGRRLFVVAILIRIAAACTMTTVGSRLGAAPAVVVLGASIYLFLRNGWGQMAADWMHILIFGGLTVAWLGDDPALYATALWFIALQLGLSYVTAGVHKLRSPDWRSGLAVRDVFNTRSYGHPALGALLSRYPVVSFVCAWSIILWECLFPIAFAGSGVAVAVLAMGVVFHIGTSLIHKFNNFFWAFSAAYPAVLFCALR